MSGNGVVTEPAIEAFGPDEGYSLDLGAPLVLKAYYYGHQRPQQRAALRRALRRSPFVGEVVGRLGWKTIRAEDWAESWKQFYGVERVGRIVIRPAWLEAQLRPGEVMVALDPGM